MKTNAKTLTDISPKTQNPYEILLKNKNAKLIRMPEVLNRTGFCRAWIYRLIEQKRFPEPIKLGERAIAFIESEIDMWIENTINLSRSKAA